MPPSLGTIRHLHSSCFTTSYKSFGSLGHTVLEWSRAGCAPASPSQGKIPGEGAGPQAGRVAGCPGLGDRADCVAGTAEERMWLSPGSPRHSRGARPWPLALATPHLGLDPEGHGLDTPWPCHCHPLIFGTHRLGHPAPPCPSAGHTHLTHTICPLSPQPRGHVLSLSTTEGDKKPFRQEEHSSPNPGTTLRQSRVGVASLYPRH